MVESKAFKFKAIVVGGSVAGLALAHMFERANIDYLLLEARDTISPSIGASIVIMPNGARILDQLGLYDGMRDEFMTGMRKTYTRRSDGRVLSSNEWPLMVEDRLKYICGICERQTFLRSMCKLLKDRSKVVTGKRVVSVQQSDEYVTVVCQDGTEYIGHIVIGADGIHSFSRQEMQRFAEATGPPGFMDKDKTSITAEYNCLFGISSPNLALTPGDSHTAIDIDHSSLLFVSAGSLPQWFFSAKMPHSYIGASNIPRFSKADMDAQVARYRDFHLTEDVTLINLVDTAEKISYFPLEEANHEHWTFGRFVCLGDAIHKMTPNMGQGGNQAIESAAVLTNCLLEMLSSKPSNSTTIPLKDLEKTLIQYQELRQQRAKMIVKLSANLTRSDALATLSHTLRFLFKPASGQLVADFSAKLYGSAPSLDFLPQPSRIADNEFWDENGKDLSKPHLPKEPVVQAKARL